MTKEIQAFDILGTNDNVPIVFVVDHASSYVDKRFEQLGLPDEVFNTHIAIDIGSEGMTKILLEKLGGRAVLARFSRLLIDPNRELWREDLIPPISDEIVIPKNQNLSPAQRQERIDLFYDPFHQAVEAEVKRYLDKGVKPLVVGVHSFTPEMNGEKRPWDIGFMWNTDQRLGLALAKEFELLGKNVGHNLPYGGDDLFHTMVSHGLRHGLLHTQIEVRQDHVATSEGVEEWAGLIGSSLGKILKTPSIIEG